MSQGASADSDSAIKFIIDGGESFSLEHFQAT